MRAEGDDAGDVLGCGGIAGVDEVDVELALDYVEELGPA